MPALVKPLFRPEALRPKLGAFEPSPAALAGRERSAYWIGFNRTRTPGNRTGSPAEQTRLRLELGIEKPSQKLQALTALDADGLIGEVKKLRGTQRPR